MIKSKRDPFWDTLKGVLIILVVLGHCGTALGNQLLSVIYAFHMPLFVLISGYFSKKELNMAWVKKMMAIFVLFDVVYMSLDLAGGMFSLKRIIVPSFAMWYILCLIYWRFILHVLPHTWLDNKLFVIALSILLSLLAGFVPLGTELSFQRAFTFWPFFIAGFYFRQINAISRIRRMSKLFALFVLIFVLIFCYNSMPVFYGKNSYAEGAIWTDMGLRLLHLGIAGVLCYCVLALSPQRCGLITDIGRYTLIIYLLHPPLVKLMKVLSLKFGYEPDLYISLLITIITVICIYSCRKFKMFKYLV